MENIILQIDNRERELVAHFQNNEPDYGAFTEFLNMDVGDIQWIDKESKIPLIVIERKTFPDLGSSIKDGRYKEQKERFIYSMQKNIRKIYLLEGDNIKKFSLPEKTFQGVVTNTMLRDHIQVYFTKNINETITFIKNIHKNIEKYIDEIVNEIVNGEEKTYNAENSCRAAKKENITSSICFRNMMMQIPSISIKLAEAIIQKFKSITDFIQTLAEQGSTEEKINFLSEIRFGSNQRKVGVKTATKIVQFLIEHSEDEQLEQDDSESEDCFEPFIKSETFASLEKTYSEEEYLALEKTVQNLQQKLSELDFEYGEKNLEYSSMKSLYHCLQEKVIDLEKKYNDADESIKTPEKNVSDDEKNVPNDSEKVIESLESKLLEKEEIIKGFMSDNHLMTEKVISLNDEIDRAKSDSNSHVETIKLHTESINVLNNTIEELKKQLEEKNTLIDNIKQQEQKHIQEYIHDHHLVEEHKEEHREENTSEHHDETKKKRGGGRKKKVAA